MRGCRYCREEYEQIAQWGKGVICADASEYDGYDAYNYFYMFNPFGESIMKPFLLKIKSSISSKPRQIHIIYVNPVCHDTLLSEGFKVEADLSDSILIPSWLKIIVYTN